MFNSKPQSLETYLAQIAHELRDLPPQARADEMREIEGHLRTMTESRGDVAGVLAQFGKPCKVGRDLRKAWERKQPEAWSRFGFALLAGLSIWYASYFTWAKFGYSEMPFKAMVEDTGAMFVMRLFLTILFIYGFFFVEFAGMGYLTKVISPKRGTSAAALVISFMLVTRIASGGFEEPNFQTNAALFLFLCIIYLTNISIGAYFGARYGRRLLSRFTNAK